MEEETTAAVAQIDERLERLAEQMRLIGAYVEDIKASHTALLEVAQEVEESLHGDFEGWVFIPASDWKGYDGRRNDNSSRLVAKFRDAIDQAKKV